MTTVLVALQMACCSSWAAGDPLLPSMTRAGPYGDPMLLLPDATATPGLPLMRFEQGASGRASTTRSVAAFGPVSPKAKAAAPHDGDDDDDDDDAPIRPGKLPTSFAKLPDPSPFAKRRSLGPHLSPDLSYDASDRTSLGIVGNSARLDGRTTPSVTLPTAASRLGTSAIGARATAAPAGTAKSRDVGLGLSLQYRFGQ